MSKKRWEQVGGDVNPKDHGAVLAVGLDPEPECYEYLPCLETVVLWDVRTGHAHFLGGSFQLRRW